MSDEQAIIKKALESGSLYLAVIVAVVGGVIGYLQRVQSGTVALGIAAFFLDMSASIFIGLTVFFGLMGLEFHIGVCAAACAYAGHVGTRGIWQIVTRFVDSSSNQ